MAKKPTKAELEAELRRVRQRAEQNLEALTRELEKKDRKINRINRQRDKTAQELEDAKIDRDNVYKVSDINRSGYRLIAKILISFLGKLKDSPLVNKSKYLQEYFEKEGQEGYIPPENYVPPEIWKKEDLEKMTANSSFLELFLKAVLTGIADLEKAGPEYKDISDFLRIVHDTIFKNPKAFLDDEIKREFKKRGYDFNPESLKGKPTSPEFAKFAGIYMQIVTQLRPDYQKRCLDLETFRETALKNLGDIGYLEEQGGAKK